MNVSKVYGNLHILPGPDTSLHGTGNLTVDGQVVLKDNLVTINNDPVTAGRDPGFILKRHATDGAQSAHIHFNEAADEFRLGYCTNVGNEANVIHTSYANLHCNSLTLETGGLCNTIPQTLLVSDTANITTTILANFQRGIMEIMVQSDSVNGANAYFVLNKRAVFDSGTIVTHTSITSTTNETLSVQWLPVRFPEIFHTVSKTGNTGANITYKTYYRIPAIQTVPFYVEASAAQVDVDLTGGVDLQTTTNVPENYAVDIYIPFSKLLNPSQATPTLNSGTVNSIIIKTAPENYIMVVNITPTASTTTLTFPTIADVDNNTQSNLNLTLTPFASPTVSLVELQSNPGVQVTELAVGVAYTISIVMTTTMDGQLGSTTITANQGTISNLTVAGTKYSFNFTNGTNQVPVTFTIHNAKGVNGYTYPNIAAAPITSVVPASIELLQLKTGQPTTFGNIAVSPMIEGNAIICDPAHVQYPSTRVHWVFSVPINFTTAVPVIRLYDNGVNIWTFDPPTQTTTNIANDTITADIVIQQISNNYELRLYQVNSNGYPESTFINAIRTVQMTTIASISPTSVDMGSPPRLITMTMSKTIWPTLDDTTITLGTGLGTVSNLTRASNTTYTFTYSVTGGPGTEVFSIGNPRDIDGIKLASLNTGATFQVTTPPVPIIELNPNDAGTITYSTGANIATMVSTSNASGTETWYQGTANTYKVNTSDYAFSTGTKKIMNFNQSPLYTSNRPAIASSAITLYGLARFTAHTNGSIYTLCFKNSAGSYAMAYSRSTGNLTNPKAINLQSKFKVLNEDWNLFCWRYRTTGTWANNMYLRDGPGSFVLLTGTTPTDSVNSITGFDVSQTYMILGHYGSAMTDWAGGVQSWARMIVHDGYLTDSQVLSKLQQLESEYFS